MVWPPPNPWAQQSETPFPEMSSFLRPGVAVFVCNNEEGEKGVMLEKVSCEKGETDVLSF